MAAPTLDDTAARLADLLTRGGGGLSDPGRHDLVFEETIDLQPLVRGPRPPDVWAVDGGQSLVADARCLQVVVTRASRVRWRDGDCMVEEEGELRPALLGCGEERSAIGVQGLPVPAESTVDVNLLRDWGEWQAIERCLAETEPGGMVLVDGDLQPDWRIAPSYLGARLDQATARGVLLAGVTKHSSLARGGAPLLGQIERDAEVAFGWRAMWWAKVATTRSEPAVQVAVARLDPDARFSFRVDLPASADAVTALGAIAALSDDAAFPGYPYPLSVADRLAACPTWVREDVWAQLDEGFDRAGLAHDVRDRAFTDRHRLMERA